MQGHRLSVVAVIVLVAVAVVGVLIPFCAMSVCAPLEAMGHMSGPGSLLDCEHMYYPSEATPAVLFQALMWFVVAAFAVVVLKIVFAEESRPVHVLAAHPPDPPGDPLVGRLRI